jgi:alpha-tubulin suppressor-like RCC1 family protein
MLAAGNRHSCALRADRTLACWGVGDADDPSDGSDEYEESWGQAVPPEGEFWYVAVGSIHSCALRPNGEAVCWGAGKTAAACEESIDACGMSVPPSGAFVALALGYTNTCGIRPDRSIECWGSNTGNRSTPPSGAL